VPSWCHSSMVSSGRLSSAATSSVVKGRSASAPADSTDSQVQLLAQSGGTIRGEFLLTAATRIARPSLEARRVAVTLADQVAAAIATSKLNPASM
jgi:hypothetical protein